MFNRLYRSLHCIGKHDEALPVYQDAIGKYRKALGESHCDTLAAEIDLAFLNIDLERPEVSYPIWMLYVVCLKLEVRCKCITTTTGAILDFFNNQQARDKPRT